MDRRGDVGQVVPGGIADGLVGGGPAVRLRDQHGGRWEAVQQQLLSPLSLQRQARRSIGRVEARQSSQSAVVQQSVEFQGPAAAFQTEVGIRHASQLVERQPGARLGVVQQLVGRDQALAARGQPERD